MVTIVRENWHSQKSYDYRRKYIKLEFSIDLDSFDNSFARAVASYILWYKMILQNNPDVVVRVESDAEKLKKYLKKNNVLPLRHFFTPPLRAKVDSDKPYNGVVCEIPTFSRSDRLALPPVLSAGVFHVGDLVGYKKTWEV